MRFLLLFVVFITLVFNLFENSSAFETHISPASLFGDVEVMPSLGVYYLPLKEYAIDKRSIFRAFVILKSNEPQNSTRARLGSLQVGYGRHVIAKYDSLVDDYVWATAIDSGNTCYDFLVLPSCDNKSVITHLGLCSGNFPQFSITRSDKYSVMIKFDGNGTYVWHKMFNSSTYHTARLSCEENNEDVIYLSSGFDQNIQLDNVTLLGSDSTFLAKLDHEASVVWAVKTTGIQVTSLASDNQYLYLGGVLRDASFGNFSLNLTSSGGGLFLGVLDKDDGEVLGLTPFAIGSSWSAISRIDVGPRQTIFISGYLAVRETLGSTTIYATEDSPSSFLMQYNTTKQEVVWSTALFPQGTYDGVLDMKIDQNGLIHLVGLFNCSGTLHDKYGCSANTYNGFYTTFTNNGELFSFLHVSGKWAYALFLTVADDGYISIYGQGIGLTFPQGPSLNLTGTYVFIAEVIEPRVEAFKVTPNQGTMLYEDFLFSTNDDLFSTYRFGFIDENNQRVFLSRWTNDRAMNTTMTTAGNATVFVQALSQHGTTVEWTSSIEVLDPNTSSLNVAPYRGAMLYDYFVFSVSGELFSTHRFGFFDGKGQRVFLSGWTNDRVLNTTMSTTGNFTVFAQGLSTHGNIMEWTSRVEVYQGETARVAQALAEQGNKLNQLNGTLLEQQLTDYTHSLVESIQIIPFNQTTQLLSYLMNLIESKQNELSGSATLETVKSISQQHSFLSENATIQASTILTNIMKNNNTSIADSIVVAYNIANVMISSNSSQSQKKSFTSMVSVLTEKIRGNMTEGQTSELSLPYLETVITKINQSSILSFNTTIVVKQPSSGANNNGNVTIVIPTSLLSQSNASFIQCEAIANPPDQYPNKCNTNQVSATISANLFAYNQQRIEVVNSDSSVPIQSMVTIPNTLNSTMGDLYKYACKYLDRNSNLWKNDSSICHAGVTSLNKSTNEAISVQCQCSQPVTHAVSLDYVQSSDGLDESSIGVGQVCTNPCGCKESEARSSKQRGMKTYGIVLIVLAGFTVIVVVIAAFTLTLLLLLRKRRRFVPTNTKNTGVTDNIELRFQTVNK